MAIEKPNFALIKTEYVCGTDSCATLARKYGVGEAMLQSRAGKEKWLSERRRLQQNAAQIAQDEIIKDMAAEIAQAGTLDLSNAMGLKRQIRRIIKAHEKPNAPEMDDRKVATLASATKTLMEVTNACVGKKVHGETNLALRDVLDDLENATDEELAQLERMGELLENLGQRQQPGAES